MKLLRRSLTAFIRLAYFLPVVCVIGLLTFIFGHHILGPGLTGSDNANFIALASWLSRWFPKIPFWFPQEGAGMSFTSSYPILNHLLIVVFAKIANLPLAVVFRIWSLISIVLTSIGLYLLSYKLTKNQTISALAAIFYPLMPITWVFLLMWGFAAEQLSFLYVPIVMIFSLAFLNEYYSCGLTKKAKVLFFFFIVGFAVLPSAHPLIFIAMVLFSGLLFVLYPILGLRKEVAFGKAVLVGILALVVVFIASSYWLVPFFRYQSFVAKGSPAQKEIYQQGPFLQNSIYFKSVFNITDKTIVYSDFDVPIEDISAWAWRNVSFPFIISLFSLVGLVASYFLNRKLFAFSLANLPLLILAVFPRFTYRLLFLPLSAYYLNWRALIVPSRFIIPLLAAFGIYAIVYLVFLPLKKLFAKVNKALLRSFIRLTCSFLVSVLAILIAAFLLWEFKNWPKYPNFLLSYGREVSVPSEKLDLRNIWGIGPRDLCYGGSNLSDVGDNYKKFCENSFLQENFLSYKLDQACTALKQNEIGLDSDIDLLCQGTAKKELINRVVSKCQRNEIDPKYSPVCNAVVENIWDQLKVENWQKELASKNLFSGGAEIFGVERKIFDLLADSSDLRVDVGTSLGVFMMIEPFYSRTPELPLYYNQATLIKTMWNYQIGIFNQKETVWPQDSILYELSKYFGLGYTIISENLVPLDKFERTEWQRVSKWDDNAFEGLALWKFNQPAGLLRVTTKPLVLVIGQDNVDGYFRVFHLANLGVLPFDQGLLVKGGENVDDYTEDELVKFDAVILEGYAYKDKQKGWQVLDKYIKDGGSVLVNTGWQYSSADWQVEKTPDFFPLKTLEWTSLKTENDYKYQNGLGLGDLDVSQLSPLIYDGTPWGVSSSEKSNLRDWAKVVLSAGDTPLVAGGKYGSGKVVWMGLDLPGHIGSYADNQEEVKLYADLVSYLLENRSGKELSAGFNRDYPDRLEITLKDSSEQKTAVYWSEAYYPDFKAKLVEDGKTKNLKAYKAGPGMTLFILPGFTNGAKIIYQYETPILIVLSRIATLLIMLGLVIVFVKPDFFNKLLETVFVGLGKIKLGKRIFGNNNEDVDY
jgi:hypothetical protein